MTGRARRRKLKSMRCLNFAAALAILPIAAVEAQRFPGRDLLDFPIGTLAEAPALALDSGDGFQNPAAIRLHEGTRARGTAIALNTGTDRGVSAQLLSVAANLPSRFTVGLSAVHAGIGGIAPTADDPQPVGDDIPYSTFVVSLTGARESSGHITSGIALRYRTGRAGLAIWFACQIKLTFGRRLMRLHQYSACGGQAREDEAILRCGV